MGLLDMPMSGSPKRMKKPMMAIKPPVDMAGRRKSVSVRPKKVKVRPTISARALERVKHSL